MDTRILALLIVVFGFSLLLYWVFAPKNRERLEAHGNLVFDSNNKDQSDEGDQQ